MQDKVDKLSLPENACCQFDTMAEGGLFVIGRRKSFDGKGLIRVARFFGTHDARQIGSPSTASTRPPTKPARDNILHLGEIEMIRNTSPLAITLACIMITFALPARSDAANNTPIYSAADEYREAVRKFEYQVLRTPYVRKSAERSVDSLEDSTSRLKTAARDPERFDRLYDRFVQSDALYARVELTFFGNSLYPPDPILDEYWSVVAQAHSRLVREIIYLKALRQSRRGYSVPIVDHRADYPARPAASPVGASLSRTDPNSFYRSEYTPGIQAETYGPRPALRSQTYRPALTGSPSPALPTSSAPALSPSSASPNGARLQRDAPVITPTPPTRLRITTRDELRSAVIGAMLQRN
jgi:hypothetical protein